MTWPLPHSRAYVILPDFASQVYVDTCTYTVFPETPKFSCQNCYYWFSNVLL
mgnify:CR=1 FL=1